MYVWSTYHFLPLILSSVDLPLSFFYCSAFCAGGGGGGGSSPNNPPDNWYVSDGVHDTLYRLQNLTSIMGGDPLNPRMLLTGLTLDL